MTDLEPRHRDMLHNSAISDAVIAERGYTSLAPGDTTNASALLGVKPATVQPAMHQGALVIPLRRLGEDPPYAYVLRPDLPVSDRKGRPRKYLYPTGLTNIFDVLPRHRDALGDPSRPLWLTEGAKKADALSTAFDNQIVAVSLNGVHGWRATNHNMGKVASPDMQHIAFNGREVVICPDGDYKTNPHVQNAINMLARLLASRADTTVYLCSLPQDPDGEKMGVDDYLAGGGTVADLLTMREPLMHAQAHARSPLLPHPVTGAALFAPAGYEVRNRGIVKVDLSGVARPIYSGAIFVSAIGSDVHTGQRTYTIAWNDEVLVERTITADVLSNRRAFSEQIGGAGAIIHDGNISKVMAFLGEFAHENREAIPRRTESTAYGLVGDGLVLADRSIGFPDPVQFTAPGPRISVGVDHNAYPSALRRAATWNAPSLWLALALALSGPVIGRIRPRRNPVLGLFGESGGGKTTLGMFAVGAFGTPTAAPLKLEASRSTTAGLFQTLERLGGLPLLIDEAHTAANPTRLESDCYQFANGQSYTKGGADGTVRGGTALSGSLILCGEAIPDFRHAGSRNRVLFVDTAEHPPLGAARGSTEGASRAQALEAAWETGAGMFAPRVLEAIWRRWPEYLAGVSAWKNNPTLASLGAWRDVLAIAAATLVWALEAAPVDGLDCANTIISQWGDLLRTGHERTDPAGDTWERLVTLLAQAEIHNNSAMAGNTVTTATWEYLEADRGGGMIACRRIDDNYWRVPTRTPQFLERVGSSAVQEFGREWVRRGLILAGTDGTTVIKTLYPRGDARVLLIPLSAVPTS